MICTIILKLLIWLALSEGMCLSDVKGFTIKQNLAQLLANITEIIRYIPVLM